MITALILAGGKLSSDLVPFAEGATNRALIRVGPAQETMLELVIRAVQEGMREYNTEGRILIAGDVPIPPGCEPVAGGASLVETLGNGIAALRPEETRLLVATADAPFLTGIAVADFLRRCESLGPTPFAYPIIEAARCYAMFPGMKRTTLRIAEGRFTGGNIALVDPHLMRQIEGTIQSAYAQRKNILGLARMLGPGIVGRLFFSRLFPGFLKIAHLEAAIGRVLGSVNPRAVRTPFAEIGADVDRPEDITIARHILRYTVK